MKKTLSLLLAVITAAALFAGCSSPAAETAAPAVETAAAAEAAAPAAETAAAAEAAPASDIKNMSIGGAGTSGTFYIMAAGYADLISKKLGINTVAEVTAGSVENVQLLADDNIEMGVVQVDVTLDALAGTGKFDAPVNLQVVTPMYPNLVQIFVLEDSDIQCFADLKGHKVSVGSPGSGILSTNEIIFQELGMDIEKDIDPQYLSFAETTDAFRNGACDAVIVNTAAPASFLTDLETTHNIRPITLSDEEIKVFTDKYPFYVKSEIPVGAYKCITEPVQTFAVWVALLCKDTLPDDVTYNVAKTIFENQETLMTVHSAAQFCTLEAAPSIKGVKYAPGAKKYLEEKGISVE